jgi:hypothetical protein
MPIAAGLTFFVERRPRSQLRHATQMPIATRLVFFAESAATFCADSKGRIGVGTERKCRNKQIGPAKTPVEHPTSAILPNRRGLLTSQRARARDARRKCQACSLLQQFSPRNALAHRFPILS